ncbi:MAG: restriction endonuclease [Thermotogota bacterium]
MKWSDLLFRVGVNAYKQWQRDAARRQKMLLRETRRSTGIRLQKEHLSLRVSLDREIGTLTAEEFESFVAALFESEGWQSALTPRTGDMGIDINLSRPSDGRRAVVQCKKWKGSVGQREVRDLYGVLMHVHADEAHLVTTGSFSAAAASFAEGKPIRLVDGSQLLQWARLHREAQFPSPPPSLAAQESEAIPHREQPPSTSETALSPAAAVDAPKVFLSEESRAFLQRTVDGFASLRGLLDIIRAESDVRNVSPPQVPLSADQVSRTCERHLALQEATVEAFAGLLRTGLATFSEKTPRHEVQSHFERIEELLRGLGTGYRDARSMDVGPGPPALLMQALLQTYESLFDDYDAFFAQAEHPGRVFLESPERALAEGIAERVPEGGFCFTNVRGDLPRASQATRRLAELLRRSRSPTGIGCLMPVVVLLCTVAALAGVPALLLWR